MAHFAELDKNNIVKQVIVVHNNELLDENGNELEQKGIDFCTNLFGGNWLQTSVNTWGNTHFHGGTPFRKNYAGVGYKYDTDRDAFIQPQPYPSWILDEETCQWKCPIPYPASNNPYTPDQEEFWLFLEDVYVWNETNQSWDVA
jgi:hypothetical protein